MYELLIYSGIQCKINFVTVISLQIWKEFLDGIGFSHNKSHFRRLVYTLSTNEIRIR